MTRFETILVERRPPVAIVTLNRPERLNALNHQLLAELEAALDELGGDTTVRAVVLTGSGKRAFASGADIADLEALETAQEGFQHSQRAHAILSKIRALPKPVICAVNGYALGGGCELALCADIIIAAENARFGQPEVNLGIIPGFGGTQNLPRLVGRTKALELILTGEQVGAQDALAIGLVNKVVPADDLLSTAVAMGSTIAEKAPLAIALAKRALYEGLDMTPRSGNEAEMTYFGLAVGTADRREGTRAFLEKRKPTWQGK